MKLDRLIGISLAAAASVLFAQTAFAGGAAPVNIYIGPDFNNDGKSDVVLENTTTGFAIGYQMNGLLQDKAAAVPGTYTPFNTIGWADVDGDGRTDKIMQYAAGGGDPADGFEVVLKTPNDITVAAGVWGVLAVPTGSYGTNTTVGYWDVDGDNKADKIYQSAGGWTGAILSVTTPLDTPVSIPGSYADFVTTAITDIDGDGNHDKVMEDHFTGYTVVSLIVDAPGGIFLNGEIPGSYGDYKTIAYADINGDGNVDKVMQIDNPLDPADGYTLGVMLNDNLTYTLIELPGLYNNEVSMGFPDMNGDGQADQVIRAGILETDAVTVCIYGASVPPQMVVDCQPVTAAPSGQVFAAFADLNDDQKSDRIFLDPATRHISAIMQDGYMETSSFTQIVTAPSNSYLPNDWDQFWDVLN
jgi:hypothetical protein